MSDEQHILAFFAEDGPAGWAFAARSLQTRHPSRPSPKFTVLVDLEKRGLVARTVIEETPNIVYAITDDGRAYLKRYPPPATEQSRPWLMLEHGTRPPPTTEAKAPPKGDPPKAKKSKR